MPVYSHMVVQISTYMQVGERGLVELVGFGRLLGRSRPEVCPIAAAFRGELFKVCHMIDLLTLFFNCKAW
jgi:hypothetical protein